MLHDKIRELPCIGWLSTYARLHKIGEASSVLIANADQVMC